MEVVLANKTVILGLLFAISEVLALIPSINGNSVFQVIYGFIKKVLGK